MQTAVAAALDLAISSLMKASKPDWSPDVLTAAPRDIRALSELRAGYNLLHDELETRLLALAWNQNSAIPASKLPDELLEEIVWSSLAREERGGASRILQLAGIAAQWRRVVWTNSRFWSTLHAAEPDAVEFKLRKARDAPLTVDCGDRTSLACLKRFLAPLGPYRHRWKHFRYLGGPAEWMSQYLNTPLPILESFDYEVVDEPDDDPADVLEFAGGPCLRDVRVENAFLHWSKGVLVGLRALAIGSITDYDLGPSQILAILEGCPELVSLALQGLSCEEVDESLPLRPVELLRLHCLRMEDVQTELALPLAQSIYTANLSVLQISSETFPSPFDPRQRAHQLFVGLLANTNPQTPLQTLLSKTNLTSLDIEILGREARVTGTYGEQGHILALRFSGASWRDNLNELLTSPVILPTVPLKLTLAPQTPTPYESHSFLRFFPSLTNIIVINQRLLKVVVDFLGVPHDSTSGRSEWPCPALKTLALADLDDEDPARRSIAISQCAVGLLLRNGALEAMGREIVEIIDVTAYEPRRETTEEVEASSTTAIAQGG